MTNCLITEISCGDDHSAFVSANGKIYTVGNNNYGKLGIGRMNSRSK